MIEIEIQEEDGTAVVEQFSSLEALMYWCFERRDIPYVVRAAFATGVYPPVGGRIEGAKVKTDTGVKMPGDPADSILTVLRDKGIIK